MKIKVELIWLGGMLGPGEDDPDEPADPHYYIVDADTGETLKSGDDLKTYEDVEAFLAQTYPGAARWVACPSSKAVDELRTTLDYCEGRGVYPRGTRTTLISYLYEQGYPEELLPRILAVLRRIPPPQR